MTLETFAGASDSRSLAPRSARQLRAARLAALAAAGLIVGLAFGALVVAVLATRLFGYEILTVRSASMEPALRAGDLIVVRPAAIEDIDEGDVVLFTSGGDSVPTVHRVAGVNHLELQVRDPLTGTVDVSTDYRLVTQGDANDLPDPREVTAGELRGEVWFSIPGAGNLTGMPAQRLLFALFGSTLLAWCAWELWRWRVRR